MAAKAGYREIFDLASLDFPVSGDLGGEHAQIHRSQSGDDSQYLCAPPPKRFIFTKLVRSLTLPVVAKFMRVPKDDPALVQSQQVAWRHMNQEFGAVA